MAILRPLIYTIILATLLMLISCEKSHRKQTLNAQYKDIYLDQFKLTYFQQLLIKCYNNSNAVREIIYTDHSGFTEPILSEQDLKLIDSLTTIDNQRLIADSIEGFRRAEGSNGKRQLEYILDKLNNKWLDSLARTRFTVNGVPSSWTE